MEKTKLYTHDEMLDCVVGNVVMLWKLNYNRILLERL